MKTTKNIKLTDREITLLLTALSTEEEGNNNYIKNLETLGWYNELKEAKAYKRRISKVFNKLVEMSKNEAKN